MNGDLRHLFVRKMEFAGGDAEKGDAFQMVFGCQCQAGAVAAFKLRAVTFCWALVDDRADGVQNIAARQVERRGDFGLSGRLGAALPFHDFRAGKAQLNAREGVDGVVDAAVIGRIAAGHAGIGGVDDRVAFQCGNVALPEVQSRLHGREDTAVRYAFFGGRLTQVGILHAKKFRVAYLCRAHVQQSAQQKLLVGHILRNAPIAVFEPFVQERTNQKEPPFILVHRFLHASEH